MPDGCRFPPPGRVSSEVFAEDFELAGLAQHNQDIAGFHDGVTRGIEHQLSRLLAQTDNDGVVLRFDSGLNDRFAGQGAFRLD